MSLQTAPGGMWNGHYHIGDSCVWWQDGDVQPWHLTPHTLLHNTTHPFLIPLPRMPLLKHVSSWIAAGGCWGYQVFISKKKKPKKNSSCQDWLKMEYAFIHSKLSHGENSVASQSPSWSKAAVSLQQESV